MKEDLISKLIQLGFVSDEEVKQAERAIDDESGKAVAELMAIIAGKFNDDYAAAEWVSMAHKLRDFMDIPWDVLYEESSGMLSHLRGVPTQFQRLAKRYAIVVATLAGEEALDAFIEGLERADPCS
jgi:hypothetical protein